MTNASGCNDSIEKRRSNVLWRSRKEDESGNASPCIIALRPSRSTSSDSIKMTIPRSSRPRLPPCPTFGCTRQGGRTKDLTVPPRSEVKTTVLAGMLTPIADVSVATRA